jgi:hypothetical protein
MNVRASIAIFGDREIEYEEERESQPIVPDQVFEAVERVIKTKSTELVKTRGGMYIVVYSEHGPFQQSTDAGDWAPVYVARIRRWDSGGVKNSELSQYVELRKENEVVESGSTPDDA